MARGMFNINDPDAGPVKVTIGQTSLPGDVDYGQIPSDITAGRDERYDLTDLNKTEIDLEIRKGTIVVNENNTIRYEGIDIPLTLIYGPLPEGASYYEVGDLNGDGQLDVYAASTEQGGEQIYGVYGVGEDGTVTSTGYDDWLEQNQTDGEEDPNLSELISTYGREAVEDAQAKLEELQKVLGQAVEDPFGTLEGIIQKTASSSKSSTCGKFYPSGTPAGTALPDWVRECVTVGVGIPIPFPIPGPLGNIFKGATVGEIEEAIKNAGYEIGKVLSGETPIDEVFDKIVDTVVTKVQDIFKDANEVSIGSILGTIGDILVGGGYILAGDLYDEYFKDKVNSVIPNVPIIPFDSSQECQDSERYTADAEGNCGPCIDPNKEYNAAQDKCIDKVVSTPTEGQSEEECNQLGRTHVPDASNETKGSCGGCKDDINTVPDDPDNPDYSCVPFGDPNPQEGDPCNTGAPLNAEGTIGPAPDFDCVPNEGASCNDPETGASGTIKDGLCVSGTTGTKCEDEFSTNYGQDGDCGPDCVSGYSIKEGDTVCSQDGTTTYTPICTEPRPSGPVTYELQDQQTAWDRECASTHCPNGTPKSEDPNCSGETTTTTKCEDPLATNTGEDGPCECPPGFVVSADGKECLDTGGCTPKGTVLSQGCDGTTFKITFSSGEIDPNTGECGKIEDSVPNYAGCGGGGDGTTTTGCSNGATEESGCDTCPDGTSVLQYEDGICPSVSPPLDCSDPAYAAANPDECGTTPPPEPPSGGGGGGGGGVGGGSGMFDLASFEITGDPQLLARTEFPIVDYLSESLSKQSKDDFMSGMLTGNIV